MAGSPHLSPVADQDPKKIAADIGFRIAELRRQKGWTQEAFSVKLGNTFQWVSQIEAGRNLTVYSLVKIANALDTRVVELLAPTTDDTPKRKRGRPKKRLDGS